MFERFTDRARRVVVLAQEEARMLKHNYVGTEHLLLGLIHEGQGVGAKALESLGIGLDMVRHEVEEVVGEGQEAPSGHIPFTPRAKTVLELSLREALELNHDYIGTEHILLGLIREGEGVAAQVLVRLGADLDRVRQQVIDLLAAHKARAEETGQAVPSAPRASSASSPSSPSSAPAEGRGRERQAAALARRIEAIEARLSAIELRLGSGPDLGDLDEQITRVAMEKQEATAAGRHEQAAELRNRERQLLTDRAVRAHDWTRDHPSLAELAEEVIRLRVEVEHLRGGEAATAQDEAPGEGPPRHGPPQDGVA
jgi:ATP-dependent Clp protease ATP-binding subunit ClpC